MTDETGIYDIPSLWQQLGDEHTVGLWESTRRAQVLESYASQVYGRTPTGGRLDDLVVRERAEAAAEGIAVRTQADLTLCGPRGARTASLLVYTPTASSASHPVPAFLSLNFRGNHATTADAAVRVSANADRIAAAGGRRIASRGDEARRWPYSAITARGYAVATLWYEELEIDLPGFAADGVRGMFDPDPERGLESWGAIGVWAWGLSRALDAVAAFPEINASAVIVVGLSRLGKAALWAAAQDERFAGVVSIDSGCGGASLFRHRGIEDISVITSARPHWFTPRFAHYRGAEAELPVDQHHLLALQAPRFAHVGSASRDPGADPEGELLSTLHASPLFELYGMHGVLPPGSVPPGQDAPYELTSRFPMPAPGRRIGGRLSYHLRQGEHDILAEDWRHILDVADAGLRC